MAQANGTKKDDQNKDVAQDGNTRKDDTPQLGYFLDYHRHWLEALELLKFQLKVKKENRHFNTLDMFYYEKLEDSFGKLEDREYFETRIANNRFYGLSKEFEIVPYTIPKSNLGLRRQKFMTCPMRVLYYAVGVYLLEVSEGYLDHYYKSHENIDSSYGGNLRIKDGKLILKPYRIYFKSHYQRFRKSLRQEIRENTERKVVIRLDIQNYFDEISIPKLLELLKRYVKPSVQEEKHFNEITRSALISFFDFVAGGASGIPQLNNDVISSFVGYLFLAFGDLFLDDELCEDNDLIRCYKIIRYMDDIYISITFREESCDSSHKFLHSLAPQIADCLYQNLGLRLNPKTRLFPLNDPIAKEELEGCLKRVSKEFEIADEENKQSPHDKIDNIIGQLKKLKHSDIDPYFERHGEVDEEMLKEVYDDSVKEMLKMRKTKTRLKNIFLGSAGFDFELVNADPTPIIILMLACDTVPEEFENFLLSKAHLTSRDINLTLTYLCQKEFSQPNLLRLLKQNPQMQEVMEIYVKAKLPSISLGYFELTKKQTLESITQPYVIEQIRLRILCEQKGEYSVALNHLFNEIHAICRDLDKTSKGAKKYEAPEVNDYLKSQCVRNETRVKIWNLSDRRNKNPVSHADPIAWPVSKEDYLDYRYHVGECLKCLLS